MEEIDWPGMWRKALEESSWGQRAVKPEYWDGRVDQFEGVIKQSNRVEMILSRTVIEQDYTILDIGAGPGTVTIPLAKRMERELGIPYVVVDYPYGVEGFKSFIEVISRHSDLKINHRVSDVIIDKLKKYRDNLPLFYEVPTCIVGDLPRISGLSRFLERELGMDVELALATSSAKENFDVSCTKLVNSYDAFYEELKGVPDIDVLLGTDEERRIRSDTIALAFPSFTRMSFVPYIGIGTLNLISDIYERIINKVWVK